MGRIVVKMDEEVNKLRIMSDHAGRDVIIQKATFKHGTCANDSRNKINSNI
jgi:hypothetical protein